MSTHSLDPLPYPLWSRLQNFVLLFFYLGLLSFATAEEKILRLPVTRDTWVSAYPGEENGNQGGADKLKTKGIQEFALLDIDPAPLRGKRILRAELHLHCISKDIQRRLTVSTVPTPWKEGTSRGYAIEPGAACFLWAEHGQRPWAYPGGDLTAVLCGRGGTLWGFADASPPDAQGWQVMAVDPRVLAARSAGLAEGFAVLDDVGSEYERDGEKFTYHLFPNRFFSSRESGEKTAPFFTVEVVDMDDQKPEPPSGLKAGTSADLPPDEACLSWITPNDRGRAGMLGFDVRLGTSTDPGWAMALPLPRYLIPMAQKPGERITLRLRDLDLPEGTPRRIFIQSVNAAGNRSTPVALNLSAAPPYAFWGLPNSSLGIFKDTAPLPKLGNITLAVADELDKFDPLSGECVPPRTDGTLAANHLFSSVQKLIRISGSRGESVAFQVLLTGVAKAVTAELRFPDAPSKAFTPSLFLVRHVKTASGRFLPDPLLPLRGAFQIPAPEVPGAKLAALFAEVEIGRNAPAGMQRGEFVFVAGQEHLVLNVQLEVRRFTLPSRLSFVPQMNCYDLPPPPLEIEYYRLAQRHRTCLNRLPYSWSGEVADGCAPRFDGQNFDWRDYDRRFAPLFDGSAFADSPRGPVPVEACYLPLNENWPANIHRHFKGGFWIENALPAEYWRDFERACRLYAEHLEHQGWKRTFFEFYLNNKVYFKQERGWSKVSAPWVFDEPTNTQDFWALRFYSQAFQRAVFPLREKGLNALFRCDISRPQWRRDLLDGLLDVHVVGSDFRRYQREVLDQKRAYGEIVIPYGSPNPVEESNVQAVAWCLDLWSRGADGVLPWQTLGTEDSWKTADPLALIYPGAPAGEKGPVASLRLKAFRRGQQDAEILALLARHRSWSRVILGLAIRAPLHLDDSRALKQDDTDAGRLTYDNTDSLALWSLRQRASKLLEGCKLDGAGLAPPPPRNPDTLPEIKPLNSDRP